MLIPYLLGALMPVRYMPRLVQLLFFVLLKTGLNSVLPPPIPWQHNAERRTLPVCRSISQSLCLPGCSAILIKMAEMVSSLNFRQAINASFILFSGIADLPVPGPELF